MSVLLDVCARAPVDVEVSPFASSERDHLFSMLPSLERGDLVVLDRGYPSHEILQTLVEEGLDFLIRVPSSHTFAAIDELRESDGDDYLFHIDPGPDPMTYAIQSNPMTPGFTGRRYFRMDTTGQIRWNNVGPALETDPPLN